MKRRAFISSSPLIASLPSGTAQALASAAQCAVNEKDSDYVTPTVEVMSPDEYIRVPCKTTRWIDIKTKEVYIAYNVDGADNLLTSEGETFDTTGLASVPWEDGSYEKDSLCLAVWQGLEDWSGVIYLGPWPSQQIKNNNTPLTHSCLASFM